MIFDISHTLLGRGQLGKRGNPRAGSKQPQLPAEEQRVCYQLSSGFLADQDRVTMLDFLQPACQWTI